MYVYDDNFVKGKKSSSIGFVENVVSLLIYTSVLLYKIIKSKMCTSLESFITNWSVRDKKRGRFVNRSIDRQSSIDAL